jgi:hypothetical protein
MTTPISTATTLPVDWRALCKALMDAIDDGIPAERIKQSPMAVLYDAAMAQPEPERVRQPNGYAYRYPSMDGSVIRFNHGQEVNGSRPLYAIPYWLGQPPTARPAIKHVAYLRRQGNYTEASEVSLSEEEKARGWTEEPLYIHHALPIPTTNTETHD